MGAIHSYPPLDVLPADGISEGISFFPLLA